MKRTLWAAAAVSALVLGLTAAQTSPSRAELASSLGNLAAAGQATDLSAAKKKKKARKGGGASKAGTGGGAAGESGAGASSDTQQGKPRGNPAVR
jgi:hypothetical protein